MEQLKRYYNYGKKYELFNVLYRDSNYILVQDNETKTYSFGLIRDFNTPTFFPTNQSCLSKEKAIDILKWYIEADSKNIEKYSFMKEEVSRWKRMLKSIN